MSLLAAKPHVLAVIPARFASTRFHAKMLAPLDGKPLVLHAYERAKLAKLVDEVVIATDSEEIIRAIAPFDATYILTRSDHPTGTDRIAEVAAKTNAEIIVNVQGDEALLDPAVVDAAIQPLLDDPEVPMSTARLPLHDIDRINDPNVVKVICDRAGRALYFSRSPIPFIRDSADRETSGQIYWQHIGLYVYRREFILTFAKLPQTPLERIEKLEQLRALEHGYPIAVIDTDYEAIGVDTPEDLERVEAILARRRQEASE